MEDSSRGASSSRQHTLGADGLPSLLVIEKEIKLNKIEFMCVCCAIVSWGWMLRRANNKNKAAVGDSEKIHGEKERKGFIAFDGEVDGRGVKSETHVY